MLLDTIELERMRSNLVVLEERTREFHRTLASFRARRPTPSDVAGECPVQLSFTTRECEILRLIAAGRDNTEIARELHFALGTIKMHVRDILAKLDATSRTEAAVRAVRLRVI
jgi:DNA-binding NarL/FixJ family response regulator